jgi:hypothetical protein
MKTRTKAKPAALLLLGLFVALLLAVHGMPVLASGTSVVAPSITSRPPDRSGSTSATFTVSTAPGARLQCSLDGAVFTACSSPLGFTGLAQGAHTLAITAILAGKESDQTTYSWVVDSVAPPAPILEVTGADPSSTATNVAEWTSAEAGLTFSCSPENGPWVPCTSPFTWRSTTSDGQHHFAVRAVDAAGNLSAPASSTFAYETARSAGGLPFTVTGSVTGLVPGVWRPVVATVHNPNPMAIRVTALRLAIGADSRPAGCRTATNLELRQSTISPGVVLTVPAGRSVTLPAQGATNPRIRLVDLPTVNQDVCKGKSFALIWSGTASG